MAKTFKNLFGGGYTTYDNDRTTYRTTKDIIGDGYTTYGSDGSTYKTHKRLFDKGYTTVRTSAGGAGAGAGGGIAGFFIVICILQICSNILSFKSYVFIAGVLLAPTISGLFERWRVSPVWCSGALFCFAAFGMINSFRNDVAVVAGTHRGGEGLLTLIVLLIILLLGLFFTLFGLGESVIGFLSAYIVLFSVAWCYLSTFARIPHTREMTHYAIGILTLLAAIDQLLLNKS